MSMTPAEQAARIDQQVRYCMQEFVIPGIKAEIESRIDEAIARAITSVAPGLLRSEVRKAVIEMIDNQFEVEIKVKQKDG